MTEEGETDILFHKMRKVKIEKIWGNSRYAGKHVIVIGGKVYTAKTGKQASRLFDKLTRKYPGEIPSLTYVPKVESLILLWR